jgi:glycosyltransferase involved in cell wall biosynthesis
MKVLFITHGEFLDDARIASGNSVRAYFIERGLAESGIEVVHVHPEALGTPSDPAPHPGIRVRVYQDRNALAELIRAEAPDALILGYWELIESLPERLDQPIVLDVVAPRILEAMYQEQLDLSDEVRRTLACYRRADRFLVGNRRQASFLIAWLILAGFDCRLAAPVDVLPISVDCAPPDRAPVQGLDARGIGLRLVSGGVSWPWRQTERWFDRLVTALQRHGTGHEELALFTGGYLYAPEPAPETQAPSPPSGIVKQFGLLPYGEMQRYLRDDCQIGVELADENPERQHSQSFRAMEFLRHGLPLICNGYTELAEQIRAYDAGWVVDQVDELDAVIAGIIAQPDSIAVKSRNARRLVDARFHYAKTIAPLLAFLRDPRQARRGPPLVALEAIAPPPEPAISSTARAASAPPVMHRRRARAWSRLKRLLTLTSRGVGRLHRTSAVILVSRSDIRPANHGAAVKIDRTAWGLSYLVDAVYLLSEDRVTYHEIRQGRFDTRQFPRWLQGIGPDPIAVRERLIAAGIPASDAFLYAPVGDWSFIVRTLYLALKTGARTYQAEFPAYGRATVWARDLLGGRALLVEHNVEYQRLAEQTPNLPAHGLDLLKAVELAWCNRSDAVIAVSEADRQRLLRDGVSPDRLHVIPHGVDLEQFDHAEPLDLHAIYRIPRDQAILVYHGIYCYPPNLEAMEVMATEILPRLERRGVSATVLAIGAFPPERTLHPRIIFTGPVDSVAFYLKGADLAVVPLQKGGGTRMKILDYFAAGLAVVSTAKGAEGIPLAPGVEAWIADDHDAFAQAIAALLAAPQTRQRMGAAARDFVAPLDWRAIAARYLELA